MILVGTIFTWLTRAICEVLFSCILYLCDKLGDVLFKPFTFGTSDGGLFAALIGSNTTEKIIDMATAAGIAIAILLLVFSLMKVFYGRALDDTPDPLKTCIRFILSIFVIYWGISIIYTYIFPFVQHFITQALNIDTTTGVSDGIAKNFKELKGDDISSWLSSNIGTVIISAVSADLGPLIEMAIYLVAAISLGYNIFKLAIENAERYLTINMLVICTPLAAGTLTSQKTEGVFKAFCQMLLANFLTIIFNIIGGKIILYAFKTITATWNPSPLSTTGIIGVIAIIALGKMVQKFDQLLSQLTFKINPINNRSLTMGALSFVNQAKGAVKTGKEAYGKVTGRGGSGGNGPAKVEKPNNGDESKVKGAAMRDDVSKVAEQNMANGDKKFKANTKAALQTSMAGRAAASLKDNKFKNDLKKGAENALGVKATTDEDGKFKDIKFSDQANGKNYKDNVKTASSVMNALNSEGKGWDCASGSIVDMDKGDSFEEGVSNIAYRATKGDIQYRSDEAKREAELKAMKKLRDMTED